MSSFRLILIVLLCVSPFLIYAEKEAAADGRKDSCMAKWLILSGINESSANVYERSLQMMGLDESNHDHPLRKPMLPFLFHHHSNDAVKFLQCFEKQTPQCRRAPSCGTSGKCLLGKNGYYCKCKVGWTGHFCAIELDSCISNPCLHGAQCTDSLGRYKCSCQPGFEGQRCENRWLSRDAFKSLPQQVADLTSAVNKMEETIKSIEKGMKTQALVISKLDRNVKMLGSLNCADLYNNGFTNSGKYVFQLASQNITVWCDMTTDGGGWTVIQRRKDGSMDFYRKWNDYKKGFGDVSGEFWLGNDWILGLTSRGHHELRIDFSNDTYAKYSRVIVADEGDQYRLTVSGFSGNAGDNLNYHNNLRFTTKDRDFDNDLGNCAVKFSGAWWYNRCYSANLNGIYGRKDFRGIVWGSIFPTFVEMKIR